MSNKVGDSSRYIVQFLLLLVFIFTIGTSGYYFIEEGWTLEEAFYMTAITVTTVGFGEIQPLSTPGRYFTVFIILLGFGSVAFMGAQFARFVIEFEIQSLLGKHSMKRKIADLTKHYIICGYGRIGQTVCASLAQRQIPFVVVENKDREVSLAEEQGYYVVRGDATLDAVLLEAGIERALGVVCVIGFSDANNLFIALSARELNPRIFIISRGEASGAEDKILRAGADIVVSPLQLGGEQIANLICQNSLENPDFQFSGALSSVKGLSLQLFCLPKDKTLRTVADVMKHTSALAVAEVQRDDGTTETLPDASFPLHVNDTVILLSREKTLEHPKTDGKLVLIADDHRALRKLFAKKINAAGHETITAADGSEALRLAEEKQPDLIVLDVMMPEKDGYEVCSLIKQMPNLKHVPVILYSGDESKEFTKRGMEAGAAACIQKTSRSSELLTKIEELL